MARAYYQNHSRRLQCVDDFDRTYRSKEAVRWCIRTPFPSNLLRHAFICQDFDQLSLFRFLLVDASRIIQQPSRTAGFLQLYRTMKVTPEIIERFEKHLGHLVCATDFFTCTKSRAMALELATSFRSRTDLLVILFKIDCDATVKVRQTPVPNRPSVFVFDIGTTFRLLSFSRQTMIVIKLRAVAGEGKRFVQEYKQTHRDVSIPTLLKELAERRRHTPRQFSISNEGMKVDELLKNGQIDQAIDVLQRFQPVSAPILVRLGHLYAEKKGEYDNALTYYTQALKLQEKVTSVPQLIDLSLSLSVHLIIAFPVR